MSVIRVQKHNTDYVVINRHPLEDPNLSFKAKGLWAYCMSRPDNWEFHVSHLATVSKEKLRAVYSAIDELIEAGYCEKSQKVREKGQKGRGRFDGMDYVVYEKPISNMFLKRRFVHAQNVDAQNVTLPSNERNQSLFLSEEVKEESKKECPSSVPSPDLSDANAIGRSSKKPFTDESKEKAEELLRRLRELYPKMKQPNLEAWAIEIDKIHRLDERSWEDIDYMIEFAMADDFWSRNILSPNAMRRNWDKLVAAGRPKKVVTAEEFQRKNIEVALQAKSQLRASGSVKARELFLSNTHLVRLDTGGRINLTENPEEFDNKMMELFNIKKDDDCEGSDGI